MANRQLNLNLSNREAMLQRAYVRARGLARRMTFEQAMKEEKFRKLLLLAADCAAKEKAI